MVFTPEDGSEKKTFEVFNYPKDGGCGIGMYYNKMYLIFLGITLKKALQNLPILALFMLYRKTILYTYQQKIRFLKNMTDFLKIFFKIFMTNNINQNLKQLKFGMNID